MPDPRDPNDFDFPLSDDSPLNTGSGYNRDEDDLRLTFDEEPLEDDDNWWDDDIRWFGDQNDE